MIDLKELPNGTGLFADYFEAQEMRQSVNDSRANGILTRRDVLLEAVANVIAESDPAGLGYKLEKLTYVVSLWRWALMVDKVSGT